MKLPEIEPARPAPSAAPAIEQAGADIRRAGDAWGGYFLAQRKAELKLESEKARNTLFDNLQQARDFIESNPVVPPEVVRRVFGGTPPPDVKLTQMEHSPEGPREVDLPAVETHTFAPQLFEMHAKRGLDEAASGITAPKWQERFRVAAEGDISRARETVLDWGRAQRLALTSLKAEGLLERAIAERNWRKVEDIATNPEYGLDRKVALKYQAALPSIKVKAGIQDRLRSERVDDLQALQRDITANTFDAPLSAEEQLRFSADAQQAEDRVLRRLERQEEAAYKRRYEQVADAYQQAANIPYGPRRLEFLDKAGPPPTGLRQEQHEHLTRYIDWLRHPPTGPEQNPDPAAWRELNEKVENGTFSLMTQAELQTQYLPRLGNTGFRHWSDLHAKALRGEGAKPFDTAEDAHIEQALKTAGFEKHPSDAAKRDAFETAKSMMEWNLITAKANREFPRVTYDTAKQALASTLNVRDRYGNLLTASKAPAQLTDKVGTAAAAVLMKLARDRGGGPGKVKVTMGDLIVERDKYLGMKDRIAEAWNTYNPEQAFTDVEGATVYAMVTNQPDAASLQRQVPAKDRENLTALIHRAVLNMQDEISRPAAAANQAKVERDVVRRQVGEAATGLRDTQKMIREGEEQRWKSLPYEERAARTKLWREFDATQEQIRSGAQERAQRMLERSRPATSAPAFIERLGPPDAALQERLAQEEVEREKLLAKMATEFRAHLETEMAAYREYLSTAKGISVLRYDDWKRARNQ